ncbi:MAG: periplasmic heavy metal sensor [Desulfovibrio sp.]|nr:periplasmic heavy metal sensor [Desulfovibrio sp.]
MKASRFALPLVMALALTAGSATVFAASPNSDQPHAGMPMNGSSNMPMNGMMGGYGMPMNGNPNMPMNGMMGGYGMPMNGNPNMPMGGMMGPGMMRGMPMGGMMGPGMMGGMPMGGMMGPGMMGGMCGMMGGMNGGFRGMLSPEGQGRFDKIMSDYRPRMDQLRGQLFVKNAELCALWRAATPDVKAVSSAAGEVSKLDAQFRSLTDELQKTLEKDVYAPERKAWEEKMKALAPNPQTPRK